MEPDSKKIKQDGWQTEIEFTDEDHCVELSCLLSSDIKKRNFESRLLEVCIDSLESALNAIHGGADELEVCSSLTEGGLTPTVGLVKNIQNVVKNILEKRHAHATCPEKCSCLNLNKKPKKPMTKEEVTLLLDLVASKKVIVSKETNAATNKLKEEAWNYVTTVYNAKSRRPRHKEQLKLKWDNLKKSARKRSQQKMNKMAAPKVNVMLRCRAGSDFCYNQLEMDTMLADLAVFKNMEIDRFVFGALDTNQNIDKDNCLKVVKSASPIPVTFHRAFDVCKDPIGSLETIIEIGFDRVLTSGQKSSVVDPEAIKVLETLTKMYGGKVQIMAGAGLTSSNAGLLKNIPCKIFHGSCKMLKSLAMGSSDQFGYYVTDMNEVIKLKQALNE